MHIIVILYCMGNNDKFSKETSPLFPPPQEFSVHSEFYLRTKNLGIQKNQLYFLQLSFIEQKVAHWLNADGKSGSWSAYLLPSSNSKLLKNSCQKKKLLRLKLGPGCKLSCWASLTWEYHWHPLSNVLYFDLWKNCDCRWLTWELHTSGLL